MGGSLIKAAVKAVEPDHVFITDVFEEKARELSEKTGANVCSIWELATKCNMIFLGVKPQNMEEMLSEISDVIGLRSDVVLVTMAAGITIERLRKFVHSDCPVIRIMPNLPASVGEGMILWCSSGADEKTVSEFLKCLQFAGKLAPMDEKLIDAGSAISGCGPAYVCLLIEALADGGVSCGLKRADAYLLAEQMVKGTAELLMTQKLHPAELKDAVCSPGGTTIAGVLELEAGAFRSTVARAVTAACEKNKKL